MVHGLLLKCGLLKPGADVPTMIEEFCMLASGVPVAGTGLFKASILCFNFLPGNLWRNHVSMAKTLPVARSIALTTFREELPAGRL